MASKRGLQKSQQKEGTRRVNEDLYHHPGLYQPHSDARHPSLANTLQLLQLRPDHQERARQSGYQEVESLRSILSEVRTRIYYLTSLH